MSFDLQQWMEAHRLQVEEALQAQVEAWCSEVPDPLWSAMRHGLLGGGKRLRPILALAAFEACGGSPAKKALVLDFATALECVHCYSLIHDDLPAMDDDDLRRGRPTCHVVYGEATAILAGDALLTEAFTRLAGSASPGSQDATTRLALVSLLARAAGAVGMVGGQSLDLELTGSLEGEGQRPGLAELEGIHRRKTGALLRASVEGGAVAAGAGQELLLCLRTYGEAIGLAFQIADDILDEVGDPEAMGKAGGADRAKGKTTYPALVGLEQARVLAREAAARSLEAIAPIPDGEALRALAAYIIERTS